MEGVSEYEVRCPNCDVSFPTGTRRCLHCGGRTGPGRFHALKPPDALFDDPVEEGESPFEVAELPRVPAPIDDDEPQPKGRGRMNAGISLVWILMAVAFSVMRACGG